MAVFGNYEFKKCKKYTMKNLEWKQYEEWPIFGKIFFVFIINMLFFLLGYFWFMSEKITTAVELIRQLNQKKELIQQQYATINQLPALKEQVNTMAELYRVQRLKYSGNGEANQLISQIASIAKNNKLNLTKIKPNFLEDNEENKVILIDLMAESEKINLNNFLYGLKRLPYLFLIKGYLLNRNVDNNYWTISMQLEFFSLR